MPFLTNSRAIHGQDLRHRTLVLQFGDCKILRYPRLIRNTPHFFNRRCNRIELKFTSMCTKEENYTRHFDTHAN